MIDHEARAVKVVDQIPADCVPDYEARTVAIIAAYGRAVERENAETIQGLEQDIKLLREMVDKLRIRLHGRGEEIELLKQQLANQMHRTQGG